MTICGRTAWSVSSDLLGNVASSGRIEENSDDLAMETVQRKQHHVMMSWCSCPPGLSEGGLEPNSRYTILLSILQEL